jgi:hypothetical protein
LAETKPWYDEIVMSALLRHARYTYGIAMRRALAEAGYDDIPKNGLYVIGGLALGAGLCRAAEAFSAGVGDEPRGCGMGRTVGLCALSG